MRIADCGWSQFEPCMATAFWCSDIRMIPESVFRGLGGRTSCICCIRSSRPNQPVYTPGFDGADVNEPQAGKGWRGTR